MIKKIAAVGSAAVAVLALSTTQAGAQQNDLVICDGSECWTLPTPEPNDPNNCAEIADVAISHSIPPVAYTGSFDSYDNGTTFNVRAYSEANCVGISFTISAGSSGFVGPFDATSYRINLA